MADLSDPPLSLLPTDGEGFAWPTPPLPQYPAPVAPVTPPPCQVEGLNGQIIGGRLLDFDPVRGQLRLRVSGSRTPLVLRFDQFRRLRLLEPLLALPLVGDSGVPAIDAPTLPFHVQMKTGAPWEGQTVGSREEPWGLFLFEPVAADGTLRRTFVPRSAYAAAEIGPRIGEALVEQLAATPEQVERALAEQHTLRSRKLGDLLLVRQIVTPEELAEAIEQQAKMPMVRIGEALLALGFISEEQLADALEQQRQDRSVPLGELLVRMGVVSRADLQTALARKMGYPLVDVVQFPADTEAVAKLPYAVASRLPALPLMMCGGRLVVALEDPSHRGAIDEIEFAAQLKAVPVLARAGVLLGAIDRAYEKIGAATFALRLPGDGAIEFEAGDAKGLAATLERGDARADDDDEQSIEQSDNSLVRLINQMILEAHGQGVSDIHVECAPGREKVRIRFRKDGQLRPYLELPHTYRAAVIARLKIMCDLDISERRKPQDGKINFSKFVQGVRLELRVATIPTQGNHEDAVLRLLTSSKPLPLEQLGLSPANLERFKALVARPYGMILCVGPTGSGKTTTLHSALGHINTPERKIWTAEDPVEITQAGLRQVQVNPKIEWTFARALRAFLRADPDVIMVGEIRDQETAQVAIEASLTGHLLLSTLHTNSAPETVTRLLDMGMDPFNFGDALLGVLAQRLVRKLCTHCRAGREATPEEEEELLQDWLHAAQGADGAPTARELAVEWRQRFGDAAHGGRLMLYRPVGCPKCDGAGWRGRAAIHELMTVSRALRHMIQTGARADELLRQALTEGLRTLRQDGIEKVLAGVTTIEEVRANS
ncbi:MAG: Flp pilus assembly complex ATPase component TadA [Rubrivivax sp.]|nr:Flp pilus assembly complex ATPase component TadA [Rubrivivax sp.]MCW5610894.1 Flp pilus assembly complex ATPase component TadA [Rubrivivax sp.]